jgi:hypothetical protein
MRRGILFVALTLVTVGGPLATSASAATTCTDTIYGPTPIKNSVTVPSGSTCNLQGIKVGGSVTVKPGGRLVIGGTSQVGGAVTAKDAGSDTSTDPIGNGQTFSVVICNTKIGGDVRITGSIDRVVVGGGPCGGNAIGGNVRLSDNTGGVELIGNAPQADAGSCQIEDARPPVGFGLDTKCRIQGSVTVKDNSGTTNPPYSGPESAAVGYNRIGGNLACSNNTNGETDIAVSSDSNTKSGQCAVL